MSANKKGTKRKAPEPKLPRGQKGIDTFVTKTSDKKAEEFEPYEAEEPEEKLQAKERKIFKFATLPHSGFKLKTTKDAWSYKVIMDESKPITLTAFSEDGICVGARSSKTYLRFEDLKDSSVIHEYLENVDKWTKRVANVTRKQLQESWGLTNDEFSSFGVVLLDGDEAWVANSYNEDPDKPRDACFWPHNQYTKIYDFKASTGKEKKATSGLAGKIERSANSTWSCNVILKSCDVTLNREAGLITYKPWPTLSSLLWIDQGQDTTVDVEKKEERKKKKEEVALKPMVEAARQFLSKSKKSKKDKESASSSSSSPMKESGSDVEKEKEE